MTNPLWEAAEAAELSSEEWGIWMTWTQRRINRTVETSAAEYWVEQVAIFNEFLISVRGVAPEGPRPGSLYDKALKRARSR